MSDNANQPISRLIVETVVDRVRQEVSSYEAERDDLLSRVIDLRTFRLDESARRQMEGLTLKSTYNFHQVRTLAALVAKLRAELKPLVEKVAMKRVLLQFAEHELADYQKAHQRNVDDRAAKAEAGLYVEPAAFADRLFQEFGVDRGGYAALTDGDLKLIAELINQRIKQNKDDQTTANQAKRDLSEWKSATADGALGFGNSD